MGLTAKCLKRHPASRGRIDAYNLHTGTPQVGRIGAAHDAKPHNPDLAAGHGLLHPKHLQGRQPGDLGLFLIGQV